MNMIAYRRLCINRAFLLYFFVGIVFVFGGLVQFLGGVSITLTNVVALFFLAGYFFWGCRIGFKVDGVFLWLALVVLMFFLVGVFNGSSSTGFFVYFYYLLSFSLVMLCASLAVRRKDITCRWLMRAVPVYLMVQIFFCIAQRVWAQDIVSLSRVVISVEDTVSGTFYLASDASLAFFCTIFNVFVFLMGRGYRYKIVVFMITAAVVFLTNSKATQFLFLGVVLCLYVRSAIEGVGRLKVFLCVFGICGGSVFIMLTVMPLLGASQAFYSVLDDAYNTRFIGDAAHRLAPLGELLFGDLKLLGGGYLTYFDPVSKEWLYYSGFSLLYSIYIDCGIFAVLALYLFVFFFVWSRLGDKYCAIILFFCFFVFSFFNFSLTDLAAVFSFSVLVFFGRERKYA